LISFKTLDTIKLVTFLFQRRLLMSTQQTLRFDVTAKVQNGNTVYEAVARIPGFRPTAVEKIENGCTQFSTRSAITVGCNNRAVSLGMTPVIKYAVPASTPAKASTTTTTTPVQRSKAKARKSRPAATRS
jgi:hypothetical protein